MKIRWLGHACFLLTARDGTRILTDPFDESVGYLVPAVEADYVTVSHDHFDHDYVKAVKGAPRVIASAGEHRVGKNGEIYIKGIPTFHDDVGGRKRGPNLVFVMEIDGIRVCHLGDLGHMLTPEQKSGIGRVDVLMVPVGGTYTIDALGAAQVVAVLAPKVVIPMHYKTDVLALPLDPVDKFLQKVGGATKVNATTVDVDWQDLKEERKVYVLQYA